MQPQSLGWEHRKWWYFKDRTLQDLPIFHLHKLQDENGNVLNSHTQRKCAGMLMRTLGARFDVVTIFQSLQLTRIFFNRYQNLHWVYHALAEKKLNQALQSTSKLELSYHITPGPWINGLVLTQRFGQERRALSAKVISAYFSVHRNKRLENNITADSRVVLVLERA